MGNSIRGSKVFSRAAQECIEETGVDPIADVSAVRVEIAMSGVDCARANLLALCLDGAADDRVDGWLEYVDTVIQMAQT